MDNRDDGVEAPPEDAADGTAAESRPDDAPADATAARHDDAADSAVTDLASEFGDARPELGPLEPGSPTVENVLFVVLGAVATVLLFVTAL